MNRYQGRAGAGAARRATGTLGVLVLLGALGCGDGSISARSTIRIQGNAGTVGVALTYVDGSTRTVTSAVGGGYALTVPQGWSGTVTPARGGYTFTPAQRTYANVTADQAGQDYAATQLPSPSHTISGNTGAAGVTMSYLDGTAKIIDSNSAGQYSFQVPDGWSGTVTPARAGHTFTPAQRSYSNVTADQTGQDYAAVSSGATRQVTGTSIVTYLPFDAAAGTITPDPHPYAQSATVAAYLPDGTTRTGTYNSATGVYTIPNVPVGTYFLRWNSGYIWTDRDTVDLGWKQAGRRNVARTSTATNVVFNLTGLNPWQSTDYLVFHDFNSDICANASGDASSGKPAAASTIASAMTVPWSSLDFPLVDTGQGDAPRIVQMVSSTSGAEIVRTAKKALLPASVVMEDGTGATITGALSDIPQTATLTVNYARSQFMAYRAQYNPSATVLMAFIDFEAVPGLAQHGFQGTDGFDNLQVYNPDKTVATDVNLTPLAAPALPNGFDRVVYAGENHYVYAQLPGTTHPYAVKGRIRSLSLTLPDATHPLRPMVSPPKNPTINGLTLFAERTGVGLTPTIGWTAPDLGTPQGYVVAIYQLDTWQDYTTGARVARVYVPGTKTSVQLPPGILANGHTYVLQIQAWLDSSWDPTAAPYGGGLLPYGYADSLSGMVTP